MNREEWLLSATDYMKREYFNTKVKTLPSKLAVSCGIPKGSSKAIGQCWDPKVSSDGTTHVFVCPSVDNSFQVLGVLLHELCHAVVGVHHGHNGVFGKLARSVGLKGRLTHTTVNPESNTGLYLTNIHKDLGDYPHKALDKSPKKKKANREKRITLVSKSHPDYTVSIKISLLAEGHPTDPWDELMEIKGG